MQGDIHYHPCPFGARGNYRTRENCYGRISHGISREHRQAVQRVCGGEPPLVTWFLLLVVHTPLSEQLPFSLWNVGLVGTVAAQVKRKGRLQRRKDGVGKAKNCGRP